MSDARRDYKFKVCFVGNSNTGKSAVLSRLKDNIYVKDHIPTIGVEFHTQIVTINGETIKLQLWDTAGALRFAHFISSNYRNSAAILIFLDSTESPELNKQCVIDKMKQIKAAILPDSLVYVVRTKADLFEAEKAHTSEEAAKKIAEENGCEFIRSVSVKDSQEHADDLMFRVTQGILAHLNETKNQQAMKTIAIAPSAINSTVSEKLTNDLMRCILGCLNDCIHSVNDFKGLSRSQKKSLEKVKSILEFYDIKLPTNDQLLNVDLHAYRNSILESNQQLERDNQIGERIKLLLDNKQVTQTRNTFSISSTIKDDLTSLYQPYQNKADKIEKLAKALADCLAKCVKDCTTPQNRAPSPFTTKSRMKIKAILQAHGIEENMDWNEFKDYLTKNMHGLTVTFKEKAHESADLDQYILGLYQNAEITQDRGLKGSTLKKELAKLLSPALRNQLKSLP